VWLLWGWWLDRYFCLIRGQLPDCWWLLLIALQQITAHEQQAAANKKSGKGETARAAFVFFL
jgi:hypothetical protein